jgi:hypothetical protein
MASKRKNIALILIIIGVLGGAAAGVRFHIDLVRKARGAKLYSAVPDKCKVVRIDYERANPRAEIIRMLGEPDEARALPGNGNQLVWYANCFVVYKANSIQTPFHAPHPGPMPEDGASPRAREGRAREESLALRAEKWNDRVRRLPTGTEEVVRGQLKLDFDGNDALKFEGLDLTENGNRRVRL